MVVRGCACPGLLSHGHAGTMLSMGLWITAYILTLTSHPDPAGPPSPPCTLAPPLSPPCLAAGLPLPLLWAASTASRAAWRCSLWWGLAWRHCWL